MSFLKVSSYLIECQMGIVSKLFKVLCIVTNWSDINRKFSSLLGCKIKPEIKELHSKILIDGVVGKHTNIIVKKLIQKLNTCYFNKNKEGSVLLNILLMNLIKRLLFEYDFKLFWLTKF